MEKENIIRLINELRRRYKRDVEVYRKEDLLSIFWEDSEARKLWVKEIIILSRLRGFVVLKKEKEESVYTLIVSFQRDKEKQITDTVMSKEQVLFKEDVLKVGKDPDVFVWPGDGETYVYIDTKKFDQYKTKIEEAAARHGAKLCWVKLDLGDGLMCSEVDLPGKLNLDFSSVGLLEKSFQKKHGDVLRLILALRKKYKDYVGAERSGDTVVISWVDGLGAGLRLKEIIKICKDLGFTITKKVKEGTFYSLTAVPGLSKETDDFEVFPFSEGKVLRGLAEFGKKVTQIAKEPEVIVWWDAGKMFVIVLKDLFVKYKKEIERVANQYKIQLQWDDLGIEPGLVGSEAVLFGKDAGEVDSVDLDGYQEISFSTAIEMPSSGVVKPPVNLKVLSRDTPLMNYLRGLKESPLGKEYYFRYGKYIRSATVAANTQDYLFSVYELMDRVFRWRQRDLPPQLRIVGDSLVEQLVICAQIVLVEEPTYDEFLATFTFLAGVFDALQYAEGKIKAGVAYESKATLLAVKEEVNKRPFLSDAVKELPEDVNEVLKVLSSLLTRFVIERQKQDDVGLSIWISRTIAFMEDVMVDSLDRKEVGNFLSLFN